MDDSLDSFFLFWPRLWCRGRWHQMIGLMVLLLWAAGPAAIASRLLDRRSNTERAAHPNPRSVMPSSADTSAVQSSIFRPLCASVTLRRARPSLVIAAVLPPDRVGRLLSRQTFHLHMPPPCSTRGKRLPAGHDPTTPKGESARHHLRDAVRGHVAEHVCLPCGGREPLLDQLPAQGGSQVLVRRASGLETTASVV